MTTVRLLPALAAVVVMGSTASCGGGSPSPSAQVVGWRTVADIPLPDGASRLDYQSLDAVHHLLYIAHLGAGTVTVVDVRAAKVVADIGGVHGVHGVLAVPERNRVYATATDDNALATIDAGSLTVSGTTPAGDFPDGLAFDPRDERVFVSDEQGGTDTVIDARTGRRLGTVDLGGEVGNTQYDDDAGLVVAAAQGRGELVAIDPVRMAVTRRYPTSGCDGPHGVFVSADGATAYVGCEGNARMVAVDLRSGAVSAAQPVGDTPDVLAVDTGLQRLYVAAERGTLTIFDISRSDCPRPVSQGFAGPDAHTVAVDPATHIVYLPLQDVGGTPVLRELVPA